MKKSGSGDGVCTGRDKQRRGQYPIGITPDEFNALAPVGTAVRFESYRGNPTLFDSRTRSKAWDMSGHTSVLIEGWVGSVCVEFLEPASLARQPRGARR